MSKRHTYASSSGKVIPEGCIFYAPMSEGDLTDHVTGNDLSGYNSSKVFWDANMQMYKVIKQTKANEMGWSVDLRYNATTNPNGLQMTSTQDYTNFCICKPENVSHASGGAGNCPPYQVMGSYSSNNNWRPGVVSMGPENATLRVQTHARAQIKHGNYNASYVINGNTPVLIADTYESGGFLYCNNWTAASQCYSKISLNPLRNDPAMYNIWIKEIMIFNRQLSMDELIYLAENFM